MILAIALAIQLQATPAPRFETEVARFEALDRGKMPPRNAVLFVGSSTIERWADLKNDFPSVPVIQRGIGSTRLDDFVRIVHRALPQTEIVFVSIKPSPSRWHLASRMRETNTLVKRYTMKNKRLKYVDVFNPMIGANHHPRPELFVDDSLHMSPAGDALWTHILKSVVK